MTKPALTFVAAYQGVVQSRSGGALSRATAATFVAACQGVVQSRSGGALSRATAATFVAAYQGVFYATIESITVCALRKRSHWSATLPRRRNI